MNIRNDLTPIFHSAGKNVEKVRSRIHYKMRDYATYRFSAPQSCAINIFFDLAQEFDELEQMHILSVLILRMFFQYDAELYLKNETGKLELVTPPVGDEALEIRDLRTEIWIDSGHCYIPVRGRQSLMVTRKQRIITDEDLMGVLALHAVKLPEGQELLFLEKFANRVGFCLHNKVLAQRNVRHILFLRKLAHDIGHNIITPNMRMQLLLNHLNKQMQMLEELSACSPDATTMQEFRIIRSKMTEQLHDLTGTFKNSALFMESLLRQSHFDLGHYVLKRSRLDLCALVVGPQFERYRLNFLERDLVVPPGQPQLPDSGCMVEADLGLLSQALANLFSNAVKYTPLQYKGRAGEIRCKVELVHETAPRAPDTASASGPAGAQGASGQAGAPGVAGSAKAWVKISVFNSGPHIAPDEAGRLFEDNFRASNATGQFGTGHGLFFVREILAAHDGKAGYEPVADGNCFYIMLPMAEDACPAG
ncbi:HAMP domain-containing histidine kinase [Desulfovibrio sp. OttesenSCG-928-A18]|nr:HAMP domain-containing histidine kinase [Desulfovibrio sp. OttesenSCG-928-A18]